MCVRKMVKTLVFVIAEFEIGAALFNHLTQKCRTILALER